MAKSPYNPQEDQALMVEIWQPEIADNPLNFVKFVFPWGRPNTPLADHTGPRKWQEKVLLKIGKIIAENRNRGSIGLTPEMLRMAVASGRGIGKSSLVAWLILWNMSCNLGSTTVVTANTEAQLTSRTWAELGKWHTLAINNHWFDKTALSLRPAPWFDELVKTQLKIDTGYYYAQAQLWSEERPDAFAGVHNPHGVLVIMDEASGIPSAIFRVTEGFFTEPVLHRYWFAFSNPRNNSGAFFECFHKNRNYWDTLQIDSRTVEGVDVAILQAIIDQNGEDSYDACVEVLGKFPQQGERQFIPVATVEAARVREIAPDPHAPLIMGVDVARYGDDQSVIAFRQGRDAKSIKWRKFKGMNTMEFAAIVAECIDKYNPDAVFIDGNGVGGGVVDYLTSLKYRVIEVQAGASADEPTRWRNKRAECWGRLREWLGVGVIPDDQQLIDDLIGCEYKIEINTGRIQIESKEEMKKRGLASSDPADALGLTFARPVARENLRSKMRSARVRVAKDVDYDILG